ncbi:MAG: GNAT family N-acetyltransferase, partial [Solirubrobacteraceae bacterium]
AREGMQLIARDESVRAIGFATLFWTWSTTRAARIGVMNDLFVAPGARGAGAADALIAACLERCRAHGAALLAWRTAPDNDRAQAVYDRVGGRRSQWLDYDLPVEAGGVQ